MGVICNKIATVRVKSTPRTLHYQETSKCEAHRSWQTDMYPV